MSAWIVSRRHIDLLTTSLLRCESAYDLPSDPSEIGRKLWLENVASIHDRYPDTAETDSNYPGPVDFTKAHAEGYTYTPYDEPIDPVVLNKQIRCYVYQTCEHVGWEDSQVRQWLDALNLALGLDFDPESDELADPAQRRAWFDAPWGID